MHVRRTRLRWWAPVLLAGAGLVLVGPVPSAQALTQKVVPGYQTNGQVNSIVTIGSTVYVGGDFTSVRAAGEKPGSASSVPRNNLAAFSATTGALRKWNPGTDGEVTALAVSPNKRTIYVGGDFNTLGGVARHNLGAVNAKSGATTGYRGNTNGEVMAIATFKKRVYVGGSFTKIRNKAHKRVAATTTKGRPIKGWKPAADSTVRTIVVAPGGKRVYLGGGFTSINKRQQAHLTALSTKTGKIQSWQRHPDYIVWDIVVFKNYGFVGGNGTGGHVDAFKPNGHRRWRTQTDGGVQSLGYYQGKVIVGGHFDNFCRGVSTGPVVGFRCPTIQANRPRLLALSHKKGNLTRWNPAPDQDPGVFALTSTKKTLYVGGKFGKIAKTGQANLAVFH
jgi:hypothetical protein